MKKISVSDNFFFGNAKSKVGRLHLKKSFSNIFITLTDLRNLVVVCFSSGSANPLLSKKRKSSPQAIEVIIRKLLVYMRFYKIKGLELVLKLRVGTHVYVLLKELKYYGFRVLKIKRRPRVPHNGIRARKMPRK